jgi:hypothetical protein
MVFHNIFFELIATKIRKSVFIKLAKWRYFVFPRILLMCLEDIPKKEAK